MLKKAETKKQKTQERLWIGIVLVLIPIAIDALNLKLGLARLVGVDQVLLLFAVFQILSLIGFVLIFMSVVDLIKKR